MTEPNQHESQLEAEKFDLEHERASRVDGDRLSADPQQNEQTAPGATADQPNGNVGKPRSLAQDAAADLIRNPMFLISAVLMVFMLDGPVPDPLHQRRPDGAQHHGQPRAGP